MSRDELQELQLKRIRKTVDQALKTPFYKKRLAKVGLDSGEAIKSLEDVSHIPFTSKDDLREAYPEGLLAVEREEVVRLHTSSGTTGTPTVIYHTAEDVANWTELSCRSIIATGAGPRDVFQNMMTYGLFTGGIGLHYAAEKVGLLVIPVSSGNTRRQLKLMRDFRTTLVHATPSYLLHLASRIEAEGLNWNDFKLQKAFVGAEAHSESTREKLEEIYGIDVYNSYGLSEMNGPGVAFECVEKDAMHIWEDAYYVEMLEPRCSCSAKAGAQGELVLTTLMREATPLLRYRTGDLTVLRDDPCPCGRVHRRIERLMGRADDMMIVNGVNIYPSQIEGIIMNIPEVGTNYQICLEKQGSLDRITIKTEIYGKLFTGDVKTLERLKKNIAEQLKASIIVNPVIELHEPGGLPVQEGKAQRVFDNREF